MKNMIKYLCIAAGLITALSVSAQEPAQDVQLQKQYHRGDTIVIKKDHERYLTGEKMSKWVYNVEHTIQQVGTRRFPNGLLLRGIISWVDPNGLINKSQNREAAEAEQRAKAEADKARQDSIAAAKAEAARQDSIARAERAAQRDSLEEAEAQAKAEAARLDSIAQAQERARRDSIAQATRDSLAAVWAQQQDTTGAAYVITKQQKEVDQIDRFTIGVRGGAASLMHKSPVGNWGIGFDALLDLQYAHYWKRFGKKMQYGILVGVGVGFARSSLSTAVNDSLPVISTSDGDIQYKIKAETVKEHDGQIQVEVPLMFSMVHEKGFFMNLGPRFMIPVYGLYNQNITEPSIDATFIEEGVTVTNALITGVLTDDQQHSKGTWKPSTLNIMLGAELGYEYTFRNKNSLGIGIYGNYSVYTLYKNDFNYASLVSLVEKPDAGKPAVLNVLSATDTYATGLGYFDVGLKLSYHFNWWKK